MDHKKTQSLTLPEASLPFGRLLLTVGLICALFVAWIGFVSALFSQSYQMEIWPALLISLPLMTLAGAMGWASMRPRGKVCFLSRNERITKA